MHSYNQYIIWGKDKKPRSPYTGEVINAHDPLNWASITDAQHAARRFNLMGIGFVLTEKDPFFCIDLDRCIHDGVWSPLALQITRMFNGCYIEVSQSGQGLHIIGKGNVKNSKCRLFLGDMEIYQNSRYIALTGLGEGDSRNDAQLSLDDLVLIDKALNANSATSVFGTGVAFRDLWEGNDQALGKAFPDPKRAYDASAADAALCKHLAFWTKNNEASIDRIFRYSALYREKWDTENYRKRTLKFVLGAGAAPLSTDTAFLSANQQLDFFCGCVYVTDIHKVFTPEGWLLKPEQFKVNYGGHVFALDSGNQKTTKSAWEAFTESQSNPVTKVLATCFRPELPSGVIIAEEGARYVNTYVEIKTARLHGDVTPFITHMQKLLPIEADRKILLAYMAACTQYPGVKFQWAPLLQGTEGNGKTLCITVLAHAIGWRYTHLPNAMDISNKFNAWIQNKLFIGIEEIYVAERQEVIDTLKILITNSRVDVQGKGENQKTGDNRANFFMTSNHQDAAKKTKADRRYCVFYTAQQTAEDLAHCGMTGDYFPSLYNWLRKDGYAKVNDFLRSYDIPDDLNPATSCQRAPITSSTGMAIENSRNLAEQMILDAIDEEKTGFMGGWVSSIALSKLLERFNLSSHRRRKLIENLGYEKHPELTDGRVDNVIPFENGKPRLYVKKGSSLGVGMRAGEIAKIYACAQGYLIS